jgi:hypothetical protein
MSCKYPLHQPPTPRFERARFGCDIREPHVARSVPAQGAGSACTATNPNTSMTRAPT